jgi:hypothetical protein
MTFLSRLLLLQPSGLAVVYVAVIVAGIGLYTAMSMATRSSPSSSTTIAVCRPGWIALRRARDGIAHRRGRIAVGYRSPFGRVELTDDNAE